MRSKTRRLIERLLHVVDTENLTERYCACRRPINSGLASVRELVDEVRTELANEPEDSRINYIEVEDRGRK